MVQHQHRATVSEKASVNRRQLIGGLVAMTVASRLSIPLPIINTATPANCPGVYNPFQKRSLTEPRSWAEAVFGHTLKQQIAKHGCPDCANCRSS